MNIHEIIKTIKERKLSKEALEALAQCFFEMAKLNNDTPIINGNGEEAELTIKELILIAVNYQRNEMIDDIIKYPAMTPAKLALVMIGTVKLLEANNITASLEDIEAGCKKKKSTTTNRPSELKPKPNKPATYKPSSFMP